MNTYALSHLSDRVLLRDLVALVAKDRATTAALLAHLAEVDARRLYRPAACPSIYVYCLRELGMAEDAACRRIRAARAAHRFPAIYARVADGRLSLSAVVLLAPFLTSGTADDLLSAAEHKSKAEIERLLAERFPRPDLPTQLTPVSSRPPLMLPAGMVAPGLAGLPAPARVDASAPDPVGLPAPERVDASASDPVGLPAPERVDASAPDPVGLPAPERVNLLAAPYPKLTPLAPQRFALQVTIAQETHDRLRHAQALLRHQLPSGDIAEVLDRALQALIVQLERQKFAATERPSRQRPSKGKRHIPAAVKREVWKRDGGQCTFKGENGKRCEAREFLEYDHAHPVARGGRATASCVRLRCRAHNQFEAERMFGAGFMEDKRREARRAAAEARTLAENRAATRVRETAQSRPSVEPHPPHL